MKGKALYPLGHTHDSICFFFEQQIMLIAGDTLFRGSIGRTYLLREYHKQIEKSVKEKLYTLNEDTRVIARHGNSTSIDYEMLHNSFVRA